MTKRSVEPFEIEFKESTDRALAEAILHGGWVEYHISCPLCELHEVHRHYICSSCGNIDFVNTETCGECFVAMETYKIRREVMGFVREHGYTLMKLGVKLAIILALVTMATWRIA